MLTSCVDDYGVGIVYDGNEFFIMPLAEDAIQVTCFRRGEWDFYGKGLYESFAAVCEAIFYGTILVERTECGHIEFDKFGNIVNLVPLTYYER